MEAYVMYVIDTETTSLNHQTGDVVEISAIRLIRDEEFNLKEEQKTWLLKVLNPDGIEDTALAINGHKREDILWLTDFGKENYKEPNDVVIDIESWIMQDGVSAMDRVFVGQNPDFDIKALQALWLKVNSSETFPFCLEKGNRVLDTKQLALIVDICNNKRRLRYDLSGLVKSFGVKKGKAHRAADDTKMTADLFAKIIKPISAVVTESFKDSYLNNEG
jgi:DNA polymerase III epsilon subunit-like protein